MKEAYFIRHGNADYFEDSLTPRGVEQVKALAKKLELILPEQINCCLAISESGRTIETAQGLIPMLSKKAGKSVYFDREGALSQMRSMGRFETVLQFGKENVFLIEKYKDSDYGFFVAHDRILVATSLAIAERFGIAIPDLLRIEQKIDLSLVQWAMNEFGYAREKAEEEVRKYALTPSLELPEIAETSIIHFDFQKKEMKYIAPEPTGGDRL